MFSILQAFLGPLVIVVDAIHINYALFEKLRIFRIMAFLLVSQRSENSRISLYKF